MDADGAEVGEAAEGEGGDGEGARVEGVFHGAELRKGDEFVEDHAGTEQIADGRGVVPGDADEPGDRSKSPTENLLQAVGKPADVEVHPAHHGVQESEESKKHDEHGADVKGEVQAVHSAASDGAENVGFFLRGRHLDAASGERVLGFGDQHLGHEQSAGGGHDHGGQQMLGVRATDTDVGGHHATGNVRHAAGHDGHQFGFGELRKKWADGEGRFGLAHENAGGDVERFRAAGAHDDGHQPGGAANDELHHAQVVKHGKKGSDKNDGGEHLEGEDQAQVGIGFAEFAEDERGADIGKVEQVLRAVAGFLKQPLAGFDTEYEKAER